MGVQLSSPEWLIKKTAFGLDEQHIQESLFTLGNGFIGSRGVFEELPEAAIPGTFITGVYDKSGAQVEELAPLISKKGTLALTNPQTAQGNSSEYGSEGSVIPA